VQNDGRHIVAAVCAVTPGSAIGDMKAPNLEEDYKRIPFVPGVKQMRAVTSVPPGTYPCNSDCTSCI